MEYLDIVDENNNLTGRKEERSKVHSEGLWHREVAVWIINENGDVLLQKRALTKKQAANKWSICAGHIDAGETVESSILRELEEELGVKVTIDELEFLFLEKKKIDFGDSKNNNFQYIYFMKTNMKLNEYKIQVEELSEIKYVTFNEFKQIIINKDPDVTFSTRSYMPKIVAEISKRI
jgi:mutator protein MutT